MNDKTVVNTKKISMDSINNWCKENKIKFDTLVKVSSLRDEIIVNLLTSGLNPYYNSLHLDKGDYNLVNCLRRNKVEGMDEIIKIKQSIYEGYRMNLARWNPKTHSYHSVHKHFQLSTESSICKLPESNKIKQTEPMYVIYNMVTIKPSMKGPIHNYSTDFLSVMDSYVNIDVEFNLH